MRYAVEFEGNVVMRDSSEPKETRVPAPEELEAFLAVVMEELLNLDARDPSIGATGADGSVEVSVTVDAADVKQAFESGHGYIRGAFHAAGAATPGWTWDWIRVEAERAPREEGEGDLEQGAELVPA